MRNSSRIKRSQEISYLLKNGKRWESRGFSVIYKKNDQHHDRVAILVSSQSGNAVFRNKIKRFFREHFRTAQQSEPSCHFDVLVRTHPGIASVPKRELIDGFNVWKEQIEK